MAIDPMDPISWKFTGKPWDLNSVLTDPDDVWAKLDLPPEEVRTALNVLIGILNSVVDGSSGADNVAMTPIAALGVAATVQAIVEAFVTQMQATTDGASGADFIKATEIAGLTGGDVQVLLEALKTLADGYNTAQTGALNTHKTSTDHNGTYYTETELNAGQLNNLYFTETEVGASTGAALVGATAPAGLTGTTVQALINALKSAVDGTALGQIPDGSLTNTKLATDVKVGSLAALTTTEKTNLVGATNEVAGSVSNLAGTGRTTETVKGVNDALVLHQADYVYQAAGGTATAITLTISGTLIEGYPITFIASANNSGSATTINTKPLYKPNTTSAPTLIAGKAFTVWYNLSGDCFFIKASAEGTAVAGDVLAGTTFSNDADTGLTGTLTLSGTAAVGDVVSGKTFYNTNAKTKLTGTGANAKRSASGTYTISGGMLTVSGLDFTPSVIAGNFSGAASLSIYYASAVFASKFMSNGTALNVSDNGGYVSSGGFSLSYNFNGTVINWVAKE